MGSMVFRALADHCAVQRAPFFDVTVRHPRASGAGRLCRQGDGTWRLAEARNRLGLIGGSWWLLERDLRYAVPGARLAEATRTCCLLLATPIGRHRAGK